MAKPPSQTPPAPAKPASDGDAIREGILAVTLAWANLENHMAVLLQHIVHDQKTFLGTAIYFAPNNSETRFEIVHQALYACIVTMKVGDAKSALIAEWEAFRRSLAKARKSRNKIMHGNVTTVHQNGKVQIRLTPAIFDSMRMLQAHANSKQWPGMSAHDVTRSAQHIRELSSRVSLFCRAVDALHADDMPTLRQKCRELADNRRPQDDHC